MKTLQNISILLFILFAVNSYSQNFVKVTDPNNPVYTEQGASINYKGASWVDYDNDGRLDLFINGSGIFHNIGNGNFEITGALTGIGPVLSNTWSDYDNDGDLDCFLVSTGAEKSGLWRNDGNGIFTKITAGVIGDSAYNTGWGCAWGDYNNDGYTDLIIAAANNFGIVHHPSRLYLNLGDGTFARIDTAHFTMLSAPYTVPSWSDFDKDGDIDLFIGSGPGGSTARDYLYRNMKTETGTAYFQRIDTGIVATSLVDGQNYNFIDYDNDGDVDIFLTNYAFTVPNNLYRNEGNGYYTKMTSAQVGTIVSETGSSLANSWGDFDNDGDEDCIITKDNGAASYFNNNGNGTFTKVDTTQLAALSTWNYACVSGDYDKDGDLDVYNSGQNSSSKGLFMNTLSNGNKWVNIKCVGTGGASGSNYSAIGTEVRVKAVVNGVPTWQYREVSAMNSFNGMNMLNVHFGLGDASIIDSVKIKWPRGMTQVFTNLAPNNFYNLIEGQAPVIGITQINEQLPSDYSLSQNYPNPFNPETSINFHIPKNSNVKIIISDAAGRKISELINTSLGAGVYTIKWNGNGNSSGIYFYTIYAGEYKETKKMLLIK